MTEIIIFTLLYLTPIFLFGCLFIAVLLWGYHELEEADVGDILDFLGEKSAHFLDDPITWIFAFIPIWNIIVFSVCAYFVTKQLVKPVTEKIRKIKVK